MQPWQSQQHYVSRPHYLLLTCTDDHDSAGAARPKVPKCEQPREIAGGGDGVRLAGRTARPKDPAPVIMRHSSDDDDEPGKVRPLARRAREGTRGLEEPGRGAAHNRG